MSVLVGAAVRIAAIPAAPSAGIQHREGCPSTG
jgi:hypothetical protein